MLNRVLLSLAVIGSFATAGVLYKNSKIEDVVKEKIDSLDNIKYKNLYCIGVQSTTCFVSTLEYLEQNRTTMKIDRVVVENIEKLNGLERDINGTFPFSLSLEDIELLNLPKEFNEYDINRSEKFTVRGVGEFSRDGSNETLKIDELSLDSDMLALVIGLDVKRSNKLTFLAKQVGLSIVKGDIFHKAYLEDDSNLSEEDFLSTLSKELSQPLQGEIEFLNSLSKSIEKFIKDKNSSQIDLNISSKSGEYINLYELSTTYNLIYILGNYDLLNRYIDDTFKIEMGVK